MRFTPKGIADAYDSTDTFPGACRSIVDLIFDQSNPELLTSRPGVTQITAFAGFTTPGVVSIQRTIGTRIYGMIGSAANPGKDEPFCWETATGAFIAITGVMAGNTPTTQLTTGDWTPPTLDQVGVYIIITHPGFDGTGVNFFGVLDVTNPAAPAWSSANTSTNGLTAVPSAVANFGNRGYFAVGNQLQYTDVLTLGRASASQAEVVGDAGNLTALSGLPLQTTGGGVVQGLLAFKATQVWQVTGDPALTPSTLALNFLSLNVGTSAPRSVVLAPSALYFASNAGPYFIDPLGQVRALTHDQNAADPDIQLPFINCTAYSRVAAAYQGSIYRICIPTVIDGIAVTNDYWYDEHRKRWTGPHSFSYACASAISNYFVLVSNTNTAKLIKSQPNPNTTSVFTDLGTTLTASVLSATFPKTGHMTEKQVCESTLELSASGADVSYNITAQDEQGNTLIGGNVAVAVRPTGGLWGTMVWGGGTLWANARNIPHVYSIYWRAPLVFKKMAILISAVASGSLQIGTFYARYQDTGYMNLTSANQP